MMVNVSKRKVTDLFMVIGLHPNPALSNSIPIEESIAKLDLTKSERINKLYRYERQTRNNELLHIIATIGCIGLIFIADKKLSCLDIVFLTSLNLYLNIYPIFLQRHNRIRIIKVLLNNGQKSPYDEFN
jgi:hypothetical protein